jgi:hypothetical protein
MKGGTLGGMTYHEAFWVATATAAPVLGLAHVVSMERQTRLLGSRLREESDQPITVRNWLRPPGGLGQNLVHSYRLVMSTGSIFIAAIILMQSLKCLSHEDDAANMTLATWGLFVVMAATLLPYLELFVMSYVVLIRRLRRHK